MTSNDFFMVRGQSRSNAEANEEEQDTRSSFVSDFCTDLFTIRENFCEMLTLKQQH